MTTVVDMVDVTSGSLPHIPRNMERHRVKLAGYTTGTPDIRWTAEDWRTHSAAVVRIDQSAGTDPRSGNVKDIERGASTIAEAIQWAKNRRNLNLHSTFYISAGMLVECENAVQAAGLADWVTYWVADWSLSRERAIQELGGRIVAIQYASPGTNPGTVIPGTRLTLHEANADLSVTVANWNPLPAHRGILHRKHATPRKPHPKVIGATGGGGLATGLIALVTKVFHVHLTDYEAGAIATAVAALVGYYVPSKKA